MSHFVTPPSSPKRVSSANDFITPSSTAMANAGPLDFFHCPEDTAEEEDNFFNEDVVEFLDFLINTSPSSSPCDWNWENRSDETSDIGITGITNEKKTTDAFAFPISVAG